MDHKPILAVLIAPALSLAGCAHLANPVAMPDPGPQTPFEAPAAETGTIYAAYQEIALFSDTRARRIGDVLTITLAERTAAQKSASSSASRDSSANLGSPTVFGREVTHNGRPILSGSMSTAAEFSGESGASQSNQLDGQISVTVVGRQPNGNLIVQGEKWLQLNHGLEYVRVSGVIRPTDIGPDNTIASYRVADARIAYGGRGMTAQASRPGLLARFFMSPLAGQ